MPQLHQYLNINGFVWLVAPSSYGSGYREAAVDNFVRARGRALHRVVEALVVLVLVGLGLRCQLGVMIFWRQQGRVHLLGADDVDGLGMTETNQATILEASP